MSGKNYFIRIILFLLSSIIIIVTTILLLLLLLFRKITPFLKIIFQIYAPSSCVCWHGTRAKFQRTKKDHNIE